MFTPLPAITPPSVDVVATILILSTILSDPLVVIASPSPTIIPPSVDVVAGGNIVLSNSLLM